MAGPSNDRRNAWKLAGLGLEFFGVFAIFVAGGWWLDRRYRPDAETPVWTLVGAGLGFVGAMYHLISEGTGRRPTDWIGQRHRKRHDNGQGRDAP